MSDSVLRFDIYQGRSTPVNSPARSSCTGISDRVGPRRGGGIDGEATAVQGLYVIEIEGELLSDRSMYSFWKAGELRSIRLQGVQEQGQGKGVQVMNRILTGVKIGIGFGLGLVLAYLIIVGLAMLVWGIGAVVQRLFGS